MLYIAICLSQKYLDDVAFDDSSYAEVAENNLQRFSSMEAYFLMLLDFRLFISDFDFKVYCSYVFSFEEKEEINNQKKENNNKNKELNTSNHSNHDISKNTNITSNYSNSNKKLPSKFESKKSNYI